MIVYGKNPVFEAIKTGKAHKVFIRKGAALYDATFNVPVKVLEKSEFDSKFHKDAQGVAAEVDEIPLHSLAEMEEDIKNCNGVIILDRIQDPHNYGAIIRSAYCFGIKHIVVPRYHNAPLTPTVCKASAGAIFYTSIIEETNLARACIRLKELDFSIVATDMEAKTNLKNFKPKGKTALIVGSEGRGIREGLAEAADVTVFIPMEGNINSLNAAQSAAIFLYEIFANKSHTD